MSTFGLNYVLDRLIFHSGFKAVLSYPKKFKIQSSHSSLLVHFLWSSGLLGFTINCKYSKLSHYINYQITPQILIKQNIRDNLQARGEQGFSLCLGRKNRALLEINVDKEVKFHLRDNF